MQDAVASPMSNHSLGANLLFLQPQASGLTLDTCRVDGGRERVDQGRFRVESGQMKIWITHKSLKIKGKLILSTGVNLLID